MVSANPGPVRFEWAVKLRVPLPVSNYSESFCPPFAVWQRPFCNCQFI